MVTYDFPVAIIELFVYKLPVHLLIIYFSGCQWVLRDRCGYTVLKNYLPYSQSLPEFNSGLLGGMIIMLLFFYVCTLVDMQWLYSVIVSTYMCAVVPQPVAKFYNLVHLGY